MPAALDWNDLRYFLAVARAGGLTPAATALGASASTVSRHIDAMEARLGVRLFLRQQRGYQLTDQGGELFAHVAEVERAMQAVERRSGEGITGRVKLAAPESLANFLIAPHLPELARRHPQLTVELVVSRQLADLSRREADIAFRLVNPAERAHAPDYIAHCTGLLRFGLYATPACLAAGGGDWQALPWVGWDETWVKRPVADQLTRLYPGREPVLRANSMQTQYAAARAGLGATLLPCFIGDTDPALVRLDAPLPNADRELWLLYHRDLKGSQRVQAMREFVGEVCERVVGK